MSYQIEFLSGEKQGSILKLTLNQTFSIGRSHSNNICLKAADISARHIIIRMGSGENHHVEILSSRITKHNDIPVNIGDNFEISSDDLIQMGENTIFTFKKIDDELQNSDEEQTVAPKLNSIIQNNDDEKTNPELIDQAIKINSKTQEIIKEATQEKINSYFDENETIAVQTRIASDDELESIKKSYKIKQQTKIVIGSIVVVLFFAATIFLYHYLKPVAEEFVSWPTDKNGDYLNKFTLVAPYLALVYPDVPNSKEEKGDSTIKFYTSIGKLQDVPLHITYLSRKSDKTLTVDHDIAFANFLQNSRSKDNSLSFLGNKSTVFVNQSRGAGIPMSYVSYTRRIKNDDFFGYAIFLRHANNIHTIMLEVPYASKWRAEPFLRQQLTDMIIYAVKRTSEHWEGANSYRKDTNIEKDLEEAKNFLNREAPVYWGKIFYRIKSALIKATLKGNKEQLEEAKNLLVKLRIQQTIWYNSQKLAYQYAEKNANKAIMQSIQATCDSVFSSEFQQSDFRYDKIKRKDWK